MADSLNTNTKLFTVLNDHGYLLIKSGEFNIDDEIITIKNPFFGLRQSGCWIVRSSNGVLCIFDCHFHSFFLMNPAIRRTVVLPKPSVECTLGCDCRIGFGFVAKNNDFKVVRLNANITGCPLSRKPIGEVYEVSTGRWREISWKGPPDLMIGDVGLRSKAFVNGNLHWFGSSGEDRKTVIISFDMTNEVFDKMPLPDALQNCMLTFTSLSVLEESLSINQFLSREDDPSSCSIWVMNKYGDARSWNIRYNVDFRMPRILIGSVLGMSRNGDLLLGINNELTAYNPNTGTRMKLGLNLRSVAVHDCPYVETLGLLSEGTFHDAW